MAPQTATQSEQNGEYSDFVETTPVGDKYNTYTRPDGSVVRRGDFVVFNDPDIEFDHYEDRNAVYERAFVGFVEHIVESDDGSPELLTSMSLGRIDLEDHNVAVSGKDVDTTDRVVGSRDHISELVDEADLSGDEGLEAATCSEIIFEFRMSGVEKTVK